MIDLGTFAVDSTIRVPFNTFDSSGGSVTVTDLAAGDVKIYKDGSVTERASSAGISVAIDFDSVTGSHYIVIDTSDNTDPGFYATGSKYDVRLEGITVDSQTLNPWVGRFGIEAKAKLGDLNDITAAQVVAALDANTYDGRTFEQIQELLVALSRGNIAVTGVGTGTQTVVIYAQDGTTALATFEVVETGSTTGSRTRQ